MYKICFETFTKTTESYASVLKACIKQKNKKTFVWSIIIILKFLNNLMTDNEFINTSWIK